ncbi:integrase arm-type DNA-binding domain-containing protein [Methylicorpusculum oleiharenae]|uniref:tyrosine-type recombinase/integrase n=1 Tax=Methylicorpusculum oleiharenae TaxID=1338687 RepID=UPI001359F083|nr:integrase arm-type DNA-binding domain-containing protein [Methylicorpusculum oleiharenae]MCD2449306.1 integrase arm-type DNA-binding domain-containing protein [Methylicorpusculum oleiharenae]
MALTDAAVKNAKPSDKQFKLFDGDGLYVLIHPNGSKYFRFDYRFAGKRKTFALGVYPKTSLKKAREKLHDARKSLAEGVDPCAKKKTEHQAVHYTFERVARQWAESIKHTIQPVTQTKRIRRFELHVFPALGEQPITEIKSPAIYKALLPLINGGNLETAHRARADISSVFNYAIVHGLAEYDPAQPLVKQIPVFKVEHRSAITDPRELAVLLRDIYNYQGAFVVQCALRLSALLFQRPGEIRQMLWADIDLDSQQWRYLVTKTNIEHIVPLSRQAVEVLTSIKQLTGHQDYVFTTRPGRPISENTVNMALRNLGYTGDMMTAHGFRSVASTLLNECGFSPDAIERQLSHMPRDKIRASYNRAQHLPERVKMMQHWADYLDGLRKGADVTPINRVATNKAD